MGMNQGTWCLRRRARTHKGGTAGIGVSCTASDPSWMILLTVLTYKNNNRKKLQFQMKIYVFWPFKEVVHGMIKVWKQLSWTPGLLPSLRLLQDPRMDKTVIIQCKLRISQSCCQHLIKTNQMRQDYYSWMGLVLSTWTWQ